MKALKEHLNVSSFFMCCYRVGSIYPQQLLSIRIHLFTVIAVGRLYPFTAVAICQDTYIHHNFLQYMGMYIGNDHLSV
jgi:hypothetical protein